jgi:hypothetical protein
MRGLINEEEVERLVKEQRETKKVQEEQGKALKSSQPKPKSPQQELDCEIEGEKKRGRLLLTLKGRGKVVFTEMDKFERWVKRRDFHLAKQVGVFNFLSIWLTPI